MIFFKRWWIHFTSFGVVLLLALQIMFSIYRTHQAENFVNSIYGSQADAPIFYTDIVERDAHADIFVHWHWTNVSPPSCPVTIIGRYQHEDGLSLVDWPVDVISAVEFKAIHLTKNGHTTIEPIYSLDVANAIKTNPGTWKYSLVFKFHCSIVNSEWLSFLRFDEVYETKPVLIEVEDSDDKKHKL